ncbi:MAG: shikimate kinase [Gemmatimonadaceae bacterium]
MHVVLVGLPGVGKSSVGRSVAARMARRFIDLDAEIERTFGQSVSQIFRLHGEPAFRLAEREATEVLVGAAPAVIAPGGGWVMNAGAMAHLRCASRIIYLRVTPDEAVRRMGRGISRRPMLAHGEPLATMLTLYETRRFQYESCADMTVETTGVRRPDVIARVLELVLAAERDFESEND